MSYTFNPTTHELIKIPGDNEKPVRKPNATPPGTKTIQRYNKGGEVKDMNKVVAETQKNAEFDKKYPPLVKTKALIDEGLVDQKDLQVTFDPTTQLFTNKERSIAFRDYNSASKFNESIGVVRQPIKPPKPFNQFDKRTYPSNQRSEIGLWDHLVEDAKKNPNDPNSKDTRKMIMRDYNNKTMRKYLSDKELKLIGKHKSQLPKQEIKIPTISIAPIQSLTPTTDPVTEELGRRVRENELANQREKLRLANSGIGIFDNRKKFI